MDRRRLLQTAAGALWFPVGGPAWAGLAEGGPQRLVVIMLRGAVDGLSLVVPHAEPAYYRLRRSIAIAPPGKPDGALPLDPRFGLHPALAGLMPLWRDGGLAFVHAAGSPDPTRSHFDAQLYLESGTPGRSRTPDGWMNRLLAALPAPHGPADAIAIGPTLPRILSGRLPAANLQLDADATRPAVLDRPAISGAFDRLYAADDALGEAYRAGRAARAQLVGDLAAEQKAADGGAPPSAGFAAQAARLGRLLDRDPRIRLAFLALGGWDTHIAQGNHQGQLANRLRSLGDGIAALAGGLGAAWRNTVILVLSEFGRTVAENGNGGTDHGHGNVVWIIGGAVKGGKVLGGWPGLEPGQLYQRRDLAVTTDFRSVIAVVLERHMGLSDEQVDTVLPGAPPASLELTWRSDPDR
jgi:uncharacterized protein (DUF1501 family)